HRGLKIPWRATSVRVRVPPPAFKTTRHDWRLALPVDQCQAGSAVDRGVTLALLGQSPGLDGTSAPNLFDFKADFPREERHRPGGQKGGRAASYDRSTTF